jgi:hydrogenase expression/formation protein HypC
MCLAIPGKIESITGEDPMSRMGKVNFGGILKEACLAYVPDVKIGDYVIVHVGFALSKVDEDEAQKVFEYLKRMEALDELGESPPVVARAFRPCDSKTGGLPESKLTGEMPMPP